MTKKERSSLDKLLEVNRDAITHVGMANYASRESLALRVVTKAFTDFEYGRNIKTFEDYETESPSND